VTVMRAKPVYAAAEQRGRGGRVAQAERAALGVAVTEIPWRPHPDIPDPADRLPRQTLHHSVVINYEVGEEL
jgi:hypothetical protein